MECNNGQNRKQRHSEWGFTFCGETPKTRWEEDDTREIACQAADTKSEAVVPFPFALSKVGDRVRIVAIRGKSSTCRFVCSRGLTLGNELAIVSRIPGGSIIVAFQGNRIGLGAGIAHKILVTDAVDVAGCSAASLNRVFTSSKAKLMNRDTNTYLCNLPLGCRGRVVGYEQVTAGYKGRLLAMGLTPGTEFTVIRHTPLDDLIEIEVGGSKLSLRKHEADVLCIEEVNHEEVNNLSGG